MATIATTTTRGGDEPIRHEISPSHAVRYAWISWLTLLLLPFLLFLFVAWSLTDQATEAGSQGGNARLANAWFVGSMAYLAIAVPAAIFWRSRVFRAYWEGEVVAPRDYLHGMLTVWIAIEIGGILSLLGCLVSGSLLPCLLPAIVAFMFFVPLWPSGHAMVRRNVGNVDDTGRYEEPR